MRRKGENVSPVQSDEDGDIHTVQNLPMVPNMPMVEVGNGGGGVQLIYRPWTFQDMKEAFTLLPPVQNDGAAFTAQLLTLCQQFRPTTTQLRRLLMTHMGTLWSKVSAGYAEDKVRLEDSTWNDASNMAHRNAFTTLCDNIKKAFLLQMNLSKIVGCKGR